jgi:hypothetical protein
LDGWFFIFAGPIEWESFSETEVSMIKRAQAQSGSCFAFMDWQLHDSEINAVVSCSDIVYIAYENFFHSSNVQVKAAYFEKPMIAGPQHLIAERTRSFGMGWCLPKISSQDVALLLSRIGSEEIQSIKKNAQFQKFVDLHSPERLDQALDEIASSLCSRVIQDYKATAKL